MGVKNESNIRYSGHRSWINNVEQQGWRYHMSDINAAIGTVQLKRFKYLSNIRKKLCKIYDNKFKNIKNLKYSKIDYNSVCPHIYIIRIHNLKHREKLRKELLKKGIQTGIHYYPNYKYKKYKAPKESFQIQKRYIRKF